MTRTLLVILFLGWCSPMWAANEEKVAVKACVVSYLEKLREERSSIAEALQGTVVSSFLGEKRRKLLEGRLEEAREDWIARDVRFEVLGEKRDRDFGVVLVAARSEYDPLSVEVIALGVQHKKDEWRPAPIPGGFEGVFLGFEEEVEKRVAELERWMSGERARLMESLNAEARDRFRESLAAVASAVLVGEDPVAVVTHFLESCRERDYLKALSCFGAMGEALDNHWLEAKSVLSTGMQGQDRRKQWRVLTDPTVLSFMGDAESDPDDATVPVYFYDPGGDGGTVKRLEFDLERIEGRWELALPLALRYADFSERRFEGLVEIDEEEEELFENFRSAFEGRYAPLPGADLEDVGKKLMSGLHSESLAELFRMLSREETLSPRERSILYRGAAKLWMLFQSESSEQDPKVVGTSERGEAGVLAVARLDVTKLNWVQLAPVHFLKSEEGWLIAPGVVEPGNFEERSESLGKDQSSVHKIYKRAMEENRRKALPSLVSELDFIGDLSGEAASEEESVELVKVFRKLLKENKPLEAMKYCAVVDRESGMWEGMRAMTYTARGARRASGEDEYLLVQKSGPWTAVSVCISAPVSAMPHYTMCLIGPTVNGPRLLVDVDLRLATNKGRSLLNDESLARLGKGLDAEHLALVKTLFQGHLEKSQASYEEWQKSIKSSP